MRTFGQGPCLTICFADLRTTRRWGSVGSSALVELGFSTYQGLISLCFCTGDVGLNFPILVIVRVAVPELFSWLTFQRVQICPVWVKLTSRLRLGTTRRRYHPILSQKVWCLNLSVVCVLLAVKAVVLARFLGGSKFLYLYF